MIIIEQGKAYIRCDCIFNYHLRTLIAEQCFIAKRSREKREEK